MRRVQPILRIYFIGIIMLLLMGVLVARLYYVQVARGAEYTAKVRSSSQVTVRQPAVRGEILDRNGIPLVQNRASFEVEIYLPDVVRAYRQVNKDVPKEKYRAVVRGMLKDMEEADVVSIFQRVILPRLEELGVAQDFNSRRMQIHYRTNTEVPFKYRQDLDFETMAKFSENNIGLPGVNVSVKPVRDYIYGSLASHILGYVGPERQPDRAEVEKYKFYQPDVEGKAQIELYMNEYLKGSAGAKILKRDAKGMVIEGEEEFVPPKQGDNVYLTLDARLQYVTEQALRVVGRGAAVVIDPNNGDVLAMASVPSFDPNKFIPAIKAQDWNDLRTDETNPLMNRAISAFAPGSTYKIPIAFAGLRKGIGDRKFHCSGGVTYGNTFMRCWIAEKNGSHGSLGLADAIKVSCNAFFFQYGNQSGEDQIVAVGNMFGLGQKSGLPLSGEDGGILPGREWLALNRPNDRWSNGHTANVSIGQGFVLASPLQMAMVAATVANGGISYYPRIIEKVVSQDGKVVLQEPAKIRANLVADGGITAEQMELVRRGMWKVVHEGGGTAGKARIKGYEVAGKTGTAQFWRGKVKDNHTWFIAFAPYDKPRYAVAVIVQGAKSGGGVAAPIAAKILEEAFAIENGKEITLAALEPAKGNFNFVSDVDFGREIPAASSITADEETPTGEATDASLNARPAEAAPPSIREEADERGRVQNRPKQKTGLEKLFNFFGGNKKRDREDERNNSSRPARPNNRNP